MPAGCSQSLDTPTLTLCNTLLKHRLRNQPDGYGYPSAIVGMKPSALLDQAQAAMQ